MGVAVGLPFMEAMLPAMPQASSAGAKPPVRLMFLYVPNGIDMENWNPSYSGPLTELPRILKPLEPFRNDVLMLSNLTHNWARVLLDGPGDHGRCSANYLTGAHVQKTDRSIHVDGTMSMDQLIASRIGTETRLASLELGMEDPRQSGNCDSGYSCAYQFNLAWRTPTTPVAPEPNPRLLFERLFGEGAPGQRREHLKMRQQQQRSILDFVLDDAKTLQRQLAARDKQKLDEYLASVREIEKRIQASERFGGAPDPAVDAPAGIPTSYQEHMRLMFDMLALAFQTDSTRIATLLLAHDGSNRTFPEIGIADGHHNLSHHMNKDETMDKISQIDNWYIQQLAWFLNKLDQTKDLDGKSVLDNSMIVYGCGNSDGNAHTHVNLPIILRVVAAARCKPAAI